MPSTPLTFADRAAHRAWLATQSTLPAGFRVGTARFAFTPVEAPKPANMTLTLITLYRPSEDFAAVFTKNAFPGAPVIIGRARLVAPALGAIVINNKISNVCAPGGVGAAERVCAEAARLLGFEASEVLPSSTGVIGWSLPVDAMMASLPAAVGALAGGSILPAAEGIMTTDLYPKIRPVSYTHLSNETRVRVLDLAKMSAQVWPASTGVAWRPLFRLKSRASENTSPTSAGVRSVSFRRCFIKGSENP